MILSERLQAVREFLGIVAPRLGPILNVAPELIDLFKGAFRQIGGNESDVESILAENQKRIDRLGDPDSFRHRTSAPPPPPPPPPPGKFDPVEGDPAFPYSPDRHDRAVISDALARNRIKRGADIYGDGDTMDDSIQFTVYGGFGQRPASPWKLLETVK